MKKNMAWYLFMFTVTASSLVAISSLSWMSAWIGLEMNLLSFIPLMINIKNTKSTESAIKYFMVQAFASSTIMLSVIISMIYMDLINNINYNIFNNLILNSALLLKMGAAPFHMWFPEVMMGLTWYNNLILMTWQKMAPLMLLSYCFNFYYMMIIIIVTTILGSLGGLNQTTIKKIMAYSSINHLGWIITAMMISENMWMMYFLIYSLLSFTIVYVLNMFKFLYINQMFSFKNNSMVKVMMFISFMSLGGLPPFLGFLPKWAVIQALIQINQFTMILILVMSTLITLFFYLRISFTAILLNYMNTTWHMNNKENQKKMNKSLYLIFISIFLLPGMSIMYTIF